MTEQKKININGQRVDYRLRRQARVRYLRLIIEHDGSLLVSAPKTYPVFLIKQFIFSRWSWVVKNLTKIKLNPSILFIQHSSKEIEEYKAKTRLLVKDRLKYFNQYYHFKYNRVAIRNQKTRWGSCSSSQNLNFNYKLCLIPSDIADYIIVHEFCHLAEMNHSARFYDLVRKTIPDYKDRQKRLRKI